MVILLIVGLIILWGFCVSSLFFFLFALLSVVSSFAIISLGNREPVVFYFNCLLMTFDYWYSLSPPHGAMVGL